MGPREVAHAIKKYAVVAKLRHSRRPSNDAHIAIPMQTDQCAHGRYKKGSSDATRASDVDSLASLIHKMSYIHDVILLISILPS